MTDEIRRKSLLREDVSRTLDRFGSARSFESSRIVVTGGHGMVGGWVVTLLASMHDVLGVGPDRVTVLSSQTHSRPAIWADLGCRVERSEWTDPTKSSEIPAADFYFHLASPASASSFMESTDQLVSLNVDGTRTILEKAARSSGRVVYASSSEIYGIQEGLLTEQTIGRVPLDSGRWIYCEAKRMGELLCRLQRERGIGQAISVRLFHSFGPGLREDDTRVFGQLIMAVITRQPFRLLDGESRRTFLYAPDAALGFLVGAGSSEMPSSLNIAHPREVSILEVVEHLQSRFALTVVRGSEGSREHQERNPVRRVSPDVSLAESIGWVPFTSPFEAFDRTIAYLQALRD